MAYFSASSAPVPACRKAGPALLLLALALQACAGAEDCDATQVSNIFTAGNCALSGGFEARVEQTRAAVQAREREILAAQRLTETQLARAERMTEDRAELEKALAEQQYQLDRLTQRLNAVSLEREDVSAEVEGLQRELAEAQAELDGLQAQTEITPQDLAEAERRLEARRQALSDALNAIVVD